MQSWQAIFNSYGGPAEACSQFSYRGYTVSYSQLFRSFEVRVFKGHGRDFKEQKIDPTGKKFMSVEDAINYINLKS